MVSDDRWSKHVDATDAVTIAERRTAQPANAAKLPMLTQALANADVSHIEGEVGKTGSRSAPRLPAASPLASVKR